MVKPDIIYKAIKESLCDEKTVLKNVIVVDDIITHFCVIKHSDTNIKYAKVLMFTLYVNLCDYIIGQKDISSFVGIHYYFDYVKQKDIFINTAPFGIEYSHVYYLADRIRVDSNVEDAEGRLVKNFKELIYEEFDIISLLNISGTVRIDNG